eukprot:TRINITY_DN1636_c0_g3_i2.p1 TRINITY_DN1636_c0_g3~~TRINITY_DN1636_c0_g3_i2.p1  ORF type:complete len:144 (+),score=20.87 TRINITY_DN1636_c0_g3_i2:64-495(+)
MDNYQIFMLELLRCLIYGHPLFISFFRYLPLTPSYHYIKKFTAKAATCRVFHISLFLILGLQEFTSIFLAIYAGLFVLSKKAVEVNSNLLSVYSSSVYIAEGLFAISVLLLFFVLKNGYKYGQANSSEQLLLSTKSNSPNSLV